MKEMETLLAGFGMTEITPPLRTPLAGRPSLGPRRARRVRDPLFARAVHLRAGSAQATVAVADLLLVTERLQRAVAEAAGVAPETLLLFGTHTHSGPGGYWRGALVRHFMGPYRAEAFEQLASQIGAAISDACRGTKPAVLSAAATSVEGANASRRRQGGPVDTALSLIRIDIQGELPVAWVSFGAHPVAGVDRDPFSVTGDYPGEICRRLERAGVRALFLPGAIGGTNPGWLGPSVPLEEHLDRMGLALERAVRIAEGGLSPSDCSSLRLDRIPFAVPDSSCRLFPERMAGRALLDGLTWPLRALVHRMATQGRRDNADLWLHLLRVGNVALLGIPSEAGPGLVHELQRALRDLGARVPIVASLCNGYTGYVHLPDEYDRVPASGYRTLTFYENAMSAAGWRTGERMLEAIGSAATHPNASPSSC